MEQPELTKGEHFFVDRLRDLDNHILTSIYNQSAQREEEKIIVAQLTSLNEKMRTSNSKLKATRIELENQLIKLLKPEN